MQTLPIELRQKIFRQLNKHSQFNCLLINRQLCREVVSILWEAPLSIRNVKGAKVINAYIKNFSNETWRYLLANGISKKSITGPPAFNYASFLCVYDPILVNCAAEDWLRCKCKSPSAEKCNVLRDSLCQLFLAEMKSMRSLTFDSFHPDQFWSSIPKERSTSLLLKNLNQIFIIGIAKGLDNLFQELAKNCQNIGGITLYCDCNPNIRITKQLENTAIGLKKTILAQNGLQWLKLYETSAILFRFISSFYSSSTTIRAIELNKVDLILLQSDNVLEALSFCENLGCLKILGCKNLNQQYWSEIARFFKKLEYLSISVVQREIPVKFLEQIFISAGDNLKYLSITYSSIINSSILDRLLPLFSCYLYNLRALEMQGLDLKNAVSSLRSCKKLQYLAVYQDIFSRNNVLDTLIEVFPTLEFLIIRDFSDINVTYSLVEKKKAERKYDVKMNVSANYFHES
ncbi:2581_t:CDS:2, partial [Ambispora leptoticha]